MVKKVQCRELLRKWFFQDLEKPHPRIFSEPIFQNYVALWYLLYRWIILAVWTLIIMCSIFEIGTYKPLGENYKWPIFLTNWDLTLGATQGFLGAFLVTKRWRMQRDASYDPQNMKHTAVESAYWYLYNVTSSLAIGVTVTYWAMVYNPQIHNMDPLNIMLHVFNSLLMTLDYWVASIPFRLYNFWWCLPIVFSYVFFSIVYYLAGGLDKYGNHYIYSVLNWNRPFKTSLICIGNSLFMVVVHCALCWLSKLREKLYVNCNKRKDRSSPSYQITPVKQPEIVV